MILDCCFSCSTLLFSLLLQLLFHLPPPFPSLALSDLLLFRTLPHHFICLLHFFPHATTMRVFSNHYFIPPIPESQLHHTAARVSAPFPFFGFVYSFVSIQRVVLSALSGRPISLSLFTPFRPSLHPATPFTQSQAAATTKATTKQQPAAAAATFLLVLLSVTVVNVLLLLLLPGTVKGVGVRKTLKKTLSLLCAFTRKHGCFKRKRLETINLLLPLFCFFSFSYTFFYRWFLYFF